MQIINRSFVIGAVFIAVLAVVSYVSWQTHAVLAGAGGVGARGCTPTETRVSVGNQSAVTILAANGLRAWARIYQPINATNTVNVSLGGTATITTGAQLTTATSTSPVPFSEMFGLNTDLPFTGAVTGITNVASSSVVVVECKY